MVGHKAVPPTAEYYGLRAEWFRNEATHALKKNDMEKYYYLYNRYVEYEQLAGQLPLNSEVINDNV